MDKSTDQENLFSIIKKVIFFNSNKSVQSCPNPLFQTQRLLFLLARYFMEYLKIQVRTNKMVNEHKVKCHPSPSGFIYQTFQGFISLQGICLIFSGTCISPLRLWEIFKSMVFRLLENAFGSQKIEFCYFLKNFCMQNKKMSKFNFLTPKCIFQ